MDLQIKCSYTYLNTFEEDVIDIDLERSEYVKARSYHLRHLKIPMLREVERNLGPKVAQVVYENCPIEQKMVLGLLPPLEGAGDTLWTSPSDLLIGKVCLKPPLTNKYLKALTHQGILEIGQQIEQKYWNRMEMEKERALGQQKLELLQCFESELKKALVCLGVKLHNQCVARIKTISTQFEVQLIDMLRMQDALMRVEFSYRLQEIKEVVAYHEVICQRAMEAAVAQTVKAMSQLFLKDLEEQQKVLCEYFGNALKKLEIKKNQESEMMIVKVKDMLRVASHHMQCRNISNMMYIICMERKKCNEEKCAIEEYYMNEMAQLNATINKQSEHINKLMEARKLKSDEVKIREQCMIKILGEFQKFINFALKASPTQAEFLLSIEKMMVFELAEALQQVEVKPKAKREPQIRKWRKAKISESEYTDLFVHDYHGCLKEQQIKIRKEENLENLPAFKFKERLYVREDFRDMVLAGIEINSDHELWTPDVAILIEQIREAAVKEPPPYQEEKPVKPSALKKTPGMKKKTSVALEIPFKGTLKPGGSEVLEPVDSDETVCGKRFTVKPCEPQGISKIRDMRTVTDGVDYGKVGTEETRKMLLATTDSKQIYKKSIAHLYTGPESTEASESVCEPSIEPVDYLDIEDYLKWMDDDVEGHKDKLLEKIKHKRRSEVNEKPSDSSTKSEINEVMRSKTTSKVGILIRSDSRIALATKDDIINKPEHDISAVHSEDLERKLEQHIDSVDVLTYRELNPKGSKLMCTKNSAEIYRKKSASKTCTKCACNLDNISKKASSVTFQSKEKDILHLDSLEKIYIDEPAEGPPKPKKKAKKPCKVVTKSKCQIVGDMRAKEYLQDPQKFTSERIHSLINMMKGDPALLRMFTSVTR